jgi:hypothetical protein
MFSAAFKTTLCSGVVLMVSSCSSDVGNAILYDMATNMNCHQSKTLSEKEECEREQQKQISYEQYKKERKEVIDGKK